MATLGNFMLLLIMCFTGMTFPSFGDDLESSFKREGKIHFLTQTYDFGDVTRGQKLVYKFEFQNTGRGPLKIQAVHSTCGCTVAAVDTSKVYEPEENGSIVVTLDTTNFRGRVAKSVTLMTNAKLLPTRSLTVQANVKEEVFADPPLVDFGEVHVTAQAELSTKINTAKGSKVQLKGLRFDSENIHAVLEEHSDHHLLKIKLNKVLKAGFLKEMVYVQTTSENLPELPIPIRADLLGSFGYQPNYLEFGALSPEQEVEKDVKVISDGTYKILNARKHVNINGFEVEDAERLLRVVPDSDGKRLLVTLKNEGNKSGSVHGRIIFETSDPAQKEFVVDFYAFFQERT